MTKNVRYTSGIYFPKFVFPPSPCTQYSRTELKKTPHGVVKVITTHSLTPQYYDSWTDEVMASIPADFAESFER